MEFSNVFTEGLLCVRLGGFQWLKEKNKVPNPQGAYILMWERKILKSKSLFQGMTNILKI